MSVEINSYLTFKLGEDVFGVNVARVMEIKEYITPKPLPQSLPFVTGVIEYRDEVIPLIDTSIKFGMTPIQVEPSTCIIVLQLTNDVLGKTYRVAILVDAVSDVFEADQSSVKTIDDDYRPGYILGTYTSDNQFIYILNADMVFNQKEIISMMDIITNIK
ncbi:chemotaxis protein CheW [Alkaliflexus imshenetskii]|uniref:chemotaxis protein CheW n=1 Tax=Alkaliflexus imshenetskii TaxID=286730 RepID=UPI0004ADBA86|nr:chemotaxis protein CheW [Alkaliflexus imshenetskii]